MHTNRKHSKKVDLRHHTVAEGREGLSHPKANNVHRWKSAVAILPPQCFAVVELNNRIFILSVDFFVWVKQGPGHHIAYLRVHSRASSLYFSRSVLYILAISGTSGSSGFGSHNNEQIESRTEKAQIYVHQELHLFLTF